MSQKMFSSEVEGGKFLGSIDVIQDAYRAISQTSSTYQLDTSPSGIKVLAFNCLSDYTIRFRNGEAAVELFELHFKELSELSNQLINGQLVVTGCGLGGYLAILYTLLHQHYADLEESNGSKTAKRPICITFGSPLIESGGHTAFEDQEAILAVLDAMVTQNAESYQMHDYSKELGSIRKTALYHGASKFNESNLSPLRAGIVFQFQEIGALNDISNDLIEKMEKKQTRMIIKSRNVYEPTKKLNDMKIILTYIEWYMKTRRLTGGYYDSYKDAKSATEIMGKNEAIRHQLNLNQYWKKTVEENDLVPQKEGAKLRKRWLYAGTNYRRIVEPLDIADHYKRGKTNYMAVRPNHYKLLEKWSEEEKKGRKPSDAKTKAASLTEDSCFWAHVEEALISLRDLKNGDRNNIATDIEKFEVYVLHSIKDFSVSPEIFVEGSSFMKWWSEYKGYKGSSYDSELARYMNNKKYISYN
ncbi:unnamed protein product [Lactuca virosa]|uniref:EDS1 EP domain-containing protein n=1 Tax=Lactuca virosa TaxID=75947 RepID=A0AAU9LYP0_9ASTR|nr:unnamed protein product [Lactuca virosa]